MRRKGSYSVVAQGSQMSKMQKKNASFCWSLLTLWHENRIQGMPSIYGLESSSTHDYE